MSNERTRARYDQEQRAKQELRAVSERAKLERRLAHAFHAVLGSWLTEEQRELVDARNAAEAEAGICHTHDFCDANMAMFDAFEAVVGRESEADSEDDSRLWNAAWNCALEHGFSREWQS